ncbi:MAG: transglycosylase domain-containing protein [Verrucomicrobiales bacterium]|nr:transglycosylase domain-containing protein [Verrucomicrobiales bacterium]
MSDLDDIFDDTKPSNKPVQSPILKESKSLDLPTLSQEIERRARKRRILIGWFKFFGFILVMGLMVAVIGLVGAYLYCKPRYDLAQTFDLDNLEKLEVASRIVDRNGQELGRIFVQNRRPISIDEVSDHFINALIAAEDGSFYTHDGVDYKGVLRAVYLNFKSKEINQGASTITQQLARNTFELRDRTVSRKVTEAFLARRIEKELGDKQRVLELYLNRIYFGSGYYGIAAASEGFFGKEAKDLTIVEAATLAGVIRNPYYRSPRKYPDSCKKTRDYVLSLMRREGYIDRETMDRAIKSPVRAVDKQSLTGKSGYVYEKVRQEVIDLIGAEEVNSGGFVIETTIDSELQTVASQAMKDQVAMIEEHPQYSGQTLAEYKEIKRNYSENDDNTATLSPPEYLQGAMLLIENRTGAILAQVGGRDFNDSMFDRTTLGRYRTGTVFKPFVYSAAFEKGFFPGTLLNDTPLNNKTVMIGGTSGILGEWGTENPNNIYENTVTARQALSLGKNAATVRIGEKAGLSTVVDIAERAGFEFSGDLKKYNATMLGRNTASLSDVALAYTIFPNEGVRPEKTHIISNIRDAEGNVIYSPTIGKASEAAIDRYTAYQISSVLSDSFESGTARKARERYGLGNFPVAGKTGTEYNFTDNWFAGFTSEVTCVGWIGFDSRKKIYDGAFSSDTVLPAWTKVMNAAAKVTDPQPFRPPVDAEKVEICLQSGELACDDCYKTVVNKDGISSQVRSTYVEYLRPDTDLSSICHIHARGGTLRGALRDVLTYKPKKRTPIVFSAEPVLPISPTIIGDDPYNATKPVHAMVAMPVAAEDAEPEMGKNGLPIARPDVFSSPYEDTPIQRVRLARPTPIQFE